MKHRRFLKMIFSLILAVAVCFGGLTAFAEGDPITGSEAKPAQAVITKKLVMADGTVTPTANFHFTVVKKEFNGDATVAALSNMPAISNKTVSLTAADEGSSASGIKTVSKESVNIFSGITWERAGVYTYRITEQPNSYSGTSNETMTYSGAVYDITAYVDNGASGPYLSAIGTTIITADNNSQTVGDKINPSPNSGGLLFTNGYTITSGGTTPLDGALSISKTVAGSMSDQTKYFKFSLKLDQPANISDTATYNVYVLDSSNDIVTSTDNAATILADENGAFYFEVTSGVPVTVYLKHGERLSVLNAAVGTSYTVEEAAVEDYTPSVSVISNGENATQTSGSLNTALSVGPKIIYIGANSADFTNTYKTITPTGITLTNLPFIIMIALAAGALIAFVVLKSRKRPASSRN